MRVNDTLPEVGTVFMWDIEEIMERSSIDVGYYGEDANHLHDEWIQMLDEKRGDSHYEDILWSIKKHGFARPLTAFTKHGELRFGDGHHRLAAAIDLGMTEVPVLVSRHWHISQDSGDWRKGRPFRNVKQAVNW